MGRKLTVIAWLWARTVKSPNPAFANVDVPLASTFMLSTKKGKEAYVEPVIPRTAATASLSRRGRRRRAPRTALQRVSGVPFYASCRACRITYDHIRAEGKAGRMGARLMAIVAEGDRERVYLGPTLEHEAVDEAKRVPAGSTETILPNNPRDFKTPLYGMNTFADLFTDRQLVALTTFSDLVGEARERICCRCCGRCWYAGRRRASAGRRDRGDGICRGGGGVFGICCGQGSELLVNHLCMASEPLWSCLYVWQTSDSYGLGLC